MCERTRVVAGVVACGLAVSLTACGGGGGGPTTPPVTTPAASRATVEATGNGALTVHPSADPTFGFALEVPIRIRETGGGEADWQYARMSLFLGGREVERAEIGSDIIRAGGYSRLTARSDKNVTLVYRLNTDDFDRVDLVLGLADINYANQFTAQVPFSSFTDINVSFTPLSVPSARVELH